MISYDLLADIALTRIKNPIAKLVLLTMARYSNGVGECFPSRETLANDSCLSVRTIVSAIQWLETNSYIRIAHRNGRSNFYIITAMEDEMADDTRAEYAHEVVSNILSLDLSKKNMTKSYTPSAEKSARVSRDTPLFLAFWQAYPRRIAKGAARIAFDRAMKVYVGKDIVQAAIKYSKYCDDSGTERQFIPHPSTWLNGERWDDDLEAEVKPTEKKHGWLNEL